MNTKIKFVHFVYSVFKNALYFLWCNIFSVDLYQDNQGLNIDLNYMQHVELVAYETFDYLSL